MVFDTANSKLSVLSGVLSACIGNTPALTCKSMVLAL